MSGRVRPARQRRAELSQHFLKEAVAARLVQATSIQPSDLVIEIGAGRGALTKPLIKQGARVTAIELDPYLATRLRRQLGAAATVIHQDFLQYPLPGTAYRVVGNVPYAGSTGMVRKLTSAPTPPLDAWLVVQKELARRLCGQPFASESYWSLMLKPFWHLEILHRLQRQDFSPPPSVDSVLLHLQFRGRPLINQATQWQDFVSSMLRGGGTMSQATRKYLSKRQLRRLADDLHFDSQQAPGSLYFEQWLGIYRFINNYKP